MESMNKKGQAQLIVNVVLGLLFIVIVFAIFFFISARLEDLKDRDIKDAQGIDLADSYVMSLRLISASDFDEMENFVISLRNNESYFGSRYDSLEYETFEDDVTQTEREIDSKYSKFFYTSVMKDGKLVKFYMMPLFISPILQSVDQVVRCDIVRSNTNYGKLRTFGGAYCEVRGVYYG